VGRPCHLFLAWEVNNAWKMVTSIQMITIFDSWSGSGLSRCLNRYNNPGAEALRAGPLIGLSSLSVCGFRQRSCIDPLSYSPSQTLRPMTTAQMIQDSISPLWLPVSFCRPFHLQRSQASRDRCTLHSQTRYSLPV
jgi:hypothetical protein